LKEKKKKISVGKHLSNTK